jgi:hypothetical protein
MAQIGKVVQWLASKFPKPGGRDLMSPYQGNPARLQGSYSETREVAETAACGSGIGEERFGMHGAAGNLSSSSGEPVAALKPFTVGV